MAGALFHSRLFHLLPEGVDSNSLDLENVASFQPSDLRDDVIGAVAGAIQVRQIAYSVQLPIHMFARPSGPCVVLVSGSRS